MVDIILQAVLPMGTEVEHLQVLYQHSFNRQQSVLCMLALSESACWPVN